VNVLDRLPPERRGAFQRIVATLRERGRRRGDTVTTRAGGAWVAFHSARAGRVFAEVRPSRNGLQAFLLPPRDELRDPRGLSRPAPGSQGWGWFRTKVSLPDGDVPAAVSLLTQSLDYAARLPPPTRRRSR